MNEIIEKENIIIEDMIYEIRGVQVMFDSEISTTKCHSYLYDKIIIHYDIWLPILAIFKYVPIKFRMETKI